MCSARKKNEWQHLATQCPQGLPSNCGSRPAKMATPTPVRSQPHNPSPQYAILANGTGPGKAGAPKEWVIRNDIATLLTSLNRCCDAHPQARLHPQACIKPQTNMVEQPSYQAAPLAHSNVFC